MALSQKQSYEEKIRRKLRERRLLPLYLEGQDAGFVRDGKNYFVDVRTANEFDFDEKELKWDKAKGEWNWLEADSVSRLYDRYGVKDHIDQDFIPKRYSVKSLKKISEADRQFDQQNFEKSEIPLTDIAVLYEFYARKRCFYIQVEGKGLFYLTNDIVRLGVPPFNPPMTLRLRAKSHRSSAIHDYGFFAAVEAKVDTLIRSPFDLSESTGMFPKI